MEHTIKFYPVGTADCILIKLEDGKTIIIDCQIKDSNEYDVKEDLLKELKKDRNGHPYVDLFISSHPHDDHCLGFGDNFYHGNPEDYDDKDNKDEIIIGELWVTPIAFNNDLADSAKDIRKEAKRRKKLYDDNQEYKGEFGNYLRIIGYDKDKEFDKRYGYIPGKTVSKINGKTSNYFDMFIHAPFKEDVKESKDNDDKNATSIVIQYIFKVKDDNGNKVIKTRLLMGGDAEHDIWQHIIDNDQDDDKLKWNIFLAPHHCSWTFFNDSSNKKEVQHSADTIMNHQIGNNSYLVTSSEEIKNNDDKQDPPSYKAKKEYLKRLKDEDRFLNTATDDVQNNVPQPIVFKVDEHGKRKVSVIRALGSSATSKPAPRAGK